MQRFFGLALVLLLVVVGSASSRAQQAYPLQPFSCPVGQFAYSFNPNAFGLPGWVCSTPSGSGGGGGGGDVLGPGSSINSYVPIWVGNGGTQLGTGLPAYVSVNGHTLMLGGALSLQFNDFSGQISGTQMPAASGDINRSAGAVNETVIGFQARPLSAAVPTSGQLMGWNGSTWGPVNAPVSGINALTQDVSATGTGSQAATVVGLQTRPVATTAPTVGQCLIWDGSQWAPGSCGAAPTTGALLIDTGSAFLIQAGSKLLIQ